LALASTSLLLELAAPRFTAPAPALTTAVPGISPSLVASDTLSAKAPATPTSPPLPPDVAFAANSFTWSPFAVFIDATAENPLPVMFVLLPAVARLVISATLMATATPTAVPLSPDPVAAWPSAIAWPSALFDEASDTAPAPALTVSPSPMLASASLPDTLSASAAATLTDPPLPSVAPWLVPLLLPDFVLASDVVLDFC
jgi:hypothetical protein